MNEFPKITLAVLSWNRMHYLRATLESAYQCIKYPNVEWIVSDNESEEPGLMEYLRGLKWLDRLLVKKQSHAEAMNEIVSAATGKYLILWPEDVQFVVKGSWLKDIVEILECNDDIGSVGLDALRKSTISSYFSRIRLDELAAIAKEAYWYKLNFRKQRTVKAKNGFAMRTLGWRCSGICGSGISSLTRTDVWRKLGQWRTSKQLSTGLADSSGGAEIDMYRRFYLSKMTLQTAISLLPVAADIITDPLGCKAKVRNGMRYGVYMPPRNGQEFYYKIRNQDDFDMSGRSHPLNFSELVEPIGFRIPCDKNGDRLKFSINTSVVCNVATGADVKFPLEES